eukprot:202841-Amphidinium_carterae.2
MVTKRNASAGGGVCEVGNTLRCSRHIGKPDVPFVCYTEDPVGLDPGIEVRSLPSSLKLWWGKAYLFSEEAGLDGHRVLFLDLDQVIVGSLASLADYSGPFALLSTDGIACELAAGGYNSSQKPHQPQLRVADVVFLYRVSQEESEHIFEVLNSKWQVYLLSLDRSRAQICGPLRSLA